MSEGKLSSRGARIVKALNQFAADLAAGTREVHGAAGEGHSEAFALSPGTSASCAGAHRGKPRGFRTVVGSESYDNPIMGAGFTSPLPDRTALSRRNRNGTGPLPGTHSHRRG